MRLWHYKLISALPRPQLLSQWRELNCIYRKNPKHILINYIYEKEYYDKKDLFVYSNLVIQEMKKRNYNVHAFAQYNNYFKDLIGTDKISLPERPFEKYQNDEYLEICYFNLFEKYIRHQKNFNEKDFNNIKNIYIKKEGKNL